MLRITFSLNTKMYLLHNYLLESPKMHRNIAIFVILKHRQHPLNTSNMIPIGQVVSHQKDESKH